MNLKNYLSEITDIYKRGDAREETYYLTLKTLVTDFTAQKFDRTIDITVLPKKTEAGNPDFRIWDGANSIIGYIEAKIPGTNLDDIEDTEQIQRYVKTFPNVIVTNFLEFRLYRDGEETQSVTIGRWNNIKTLRAVPPVEKAGEFGALLERFIGYSQPAITSAEKLAKVLAQRTRFLRDEIIKIELPENDDIKGFYEAFTKYLIANLSEDDFADLYSQTITYGLFAARLRSRDGFSRTTAYLYIPKTIGILRDIFGFVSMGALPKQMETIIDDIAAVLSATDVKSILDEYYKAGKGSDPIIHFYETFLQEYDPTTREMRGVYYTPEPVVDFMVRSVNEILKETFGIAAGLAGENVTLLDPAGGTLSFFTMAMQVAVDEYVKLYGEGMKRQFIKQQLLKNFYAFELMMAPYAIGHMKTSFMLEELGYQLEDDDRVQYYLTNTLEMEDLDTVKIPGLSSLSKESHLAGEVKKNTKIQIVIGNPPYSGHSSNNSKWIREKVNDYYFVDGVSINEKNSKWLQDDYVKFIRFAQYKIDQAGEGIVCMITNHGYIDNPTFRGMRKSLIDSFDEIYILDLHGNTLKKEKAPKGGKDENVFDIQQGVAIIFLIRKNAQRASAQIEFSEKFGLRKEKYDFLAGNGRLTLTWKSLHPTAPFFLFNEMINENDRLYYAQISLNDIFIKKNTGVITKKDHFAISFDKSVLSKRLKDFCGSTISDKDITTIYDLRERDKDKWVLSSARSQCRMIEDRESLIHPISYRPFDKRLIFYHPSIVARCVPDLMYHMLQDNTALTVGRQWSAVGSEAYDTVFIADALVDLNLFRRGGEVVFPLYIYPKEGDVFQEKLFNIREDIIEMFNKAFAHYTAVRVEPEKIFYYIYGLLYSVKYRTKFGEFLKIDFPRIPIVRDYEKFMEISRFGEKLAGLHLLKAQDLKTPSAKYYGTGSNQVDTIDYRDQQVYINDDNHFGSVPEDVFQFTIGGYQVCHKWLKDRKGKELTLDEVQTYCKIVTALEKTIEIQKQIDEVIEI